MRMNCLHKTGRLGKITIILLSLVFSVTCAFSQSFTAKLLSANGSSWGQTNHIEKTSKGNDVYIGEKDPSTFNSTDYQYIKARLAYLSNDPMGSCNIRSIQKTTYAEGSEITSDPTKYYKKTCLSISYDKDWLDWKSVEAKEAAVNVNTSYPAIVYAYSVPNGEVYDVFFYVSDDSNPLVEGQCTKLFKVGPDEYEGKYEDLSGLAYWYFENVTELDEMFSQCGSLKKVGISGDFSLVKTLKNMFYNCASIEEVQINGDFGDKLTTLEGTFSNCSHLKSITMGGDFKNVTSISSMFKNCSALEKLSLNGTFSTKLTTANNAFEGCTSIKSFSNIATSDADVKLTGCNFSNVTTLSKMFNGCTALETVEIKGDLRKVKTTESMFNNCKVLSSAKLDGNFRDLQNLTSMFSGCKALTTFSMTTEGDDAKASLRGDFSNVKSMNNVCANATSLTQAKIEGNFNEVTTLKDAFSSCSTLTNVEIKGSFKNLNNIANLFNACENLTTATIDGKFSALGSLSSLFNGRKTLRNAVIRGEFPLVSSLYRMFYNCNALTSATIEADFPKVTSTKEMFQYCNAINSIAFNTGEDADIAITGAFTELTTMNGTFRDMATLNSANINLPESVTDVNNLFKNTKLTTTTVNNVTNVNTMESMFSSCANLTEVTLNGDFSNVTTIKELFNNSTAVSSVSLNDGDANFTSLLNVEKMINNWDISKYDVFSSIISQMNLNTTNLPGGKGIGNYRLNQNKPTGWSNKTVKTKNLVEYEITEGYLGLGTFLPIELSYFTVSQDGEDVFFEWGTETETNNDFFTIEKSVDGVSFHEVARIAGMGTTSLFSSYEYSLPATFDGVTYFRLKQTDYNGDFSYSDVKSVTIDHGYLFLYPIPASDYITIEGDYADVKFCDNQGQIHHPSRMEGNTYPLTEYPQGVLYAIITMKNGEIVTKQFIRK